MLPWKTQEDPLKQRNRTRHTLKKFCAPRATAPRRGPFLIFSGQLFASIKANQFFVWFLFHARLLWSLLLRILLCCCNCCAFSSNCLAKQHMSTAEPLMGVLIGWKLLGLSNHTHALRLDDTAPHCSLSLGSTHSQQIAHLHFLLLGSAVNCLALKKCQYDLNQKQKHLTALQVSCQ